MVFVLISPAGDTTPREPLLSVGATATYHGIQKSREEPGGQKKAPGAAEALGSSPGQRHAVTTTIWILKLPAVLVGKQCFPQTTGTRVPGGFLNEHLLQEVRGEALEQ